MTRTCSRGRRVGRRECRRRLHNTRSSGQLEDQEQAAPAPTGLSVQASEHIHGRMSSVEAKITCIQWHGSDESDGTMPRGRSERTSIACCCACGYVLEQRTRQRWSGEGQQDSEENCIRKDSMSVKPNNSIKEANKRLTDGTGAG